LAEVIMDLKASVRPPPRLTELFPPEAIRVGLHEHTKSAVIEELVHHCVVLGYLRRQEEAPILEKILERENLGSTALGHGIALPHCRWRSLDRFVGVAGLMQQGIQFDAADGMPVDRVFLTLAPSDNHEQSFDILGRLVAIGRNTSLRVLLHGCQTVEDVSAFFDELDRPVAGRLDELAKMSLSKVDRETRDPWRELAYFSLTREDRPARDRQGENSPELPRWL